MTDDQKKYVDGNWKNKTINMMAKECGIRDNDVSNYCRHMKYDPPTKKDLVIKQVWLLHKTHTVEEIAMIANYDECKVRDIFIELDLRSIIKFDSGTARKIEKQVFECTGVFLRCNELQTEATPKVTSPDAHLQKKPVDRIKDKYNQSGSDFLDDLYGIKTTKRNNKIL